MTQEQINQKYAQICQQIGDASFRIRQHEQVLDKTNSAISDLDDKIDFLVLEANRLNELLNILASNKNVSLNAAPAAKALKEVTNE